MRASAEFSRWEDERGVALVLTLAILVIATILVVGFVSSMRTERQAATSMANNAGAAIIAKSAIDHAISILDYNIPQPRRPEPSPTPLQYVDYTRFGGTAISDVSAVNWVTQPGMLTTIARHIFTNSDTVRQVPLSSNPDPAYSSTVDDANINPPLLNGSANVFTQQNQDMRVAWIPVIKDPTVAANLTNQIAGRYGFWIDDESTKVNINTAYGKTSAMNFTQLTPGTIQVNAATYPLGHPSSVNLDLLGSLNRSSLATAIGIKGGLPAIDEIKAFVTGNPDDFFNTNKFNLTAYGRAPEFNVFGKSKLYFMRRATGQLGYPIFQFFRDRDAPNYFPSDENATGADRLAAYYTAAGIASYFNRSDWPGTPGDPSIPNEGLSFVKKWDRNSSGGSYPGLGVGDMGKREADQVAWNLLSFGSFAAGDFNGIPITQTSGQYYQLANAMTSADPGFVSINKPNNDAVIGPLSRKAMLPAYPVPLINEACLNIAPESYTNKDGSQHYRLHVSLTTELWLPPGYPPFNFDQAKTTVGLTYLYHHVTQAVPGSANSTQEDSKYVDNGLAAPNDNGIKKFWASNGTGVMNPGQYLQLTTILPFYIRNGGGFSNGSIGSEDFATSGTISVQFKMRLYALTQQKNGASYGTKRTYQLIPVWDTHDPRTSAPPTTLNPPPPPVPAPKPTPPLTVPGEDLNAYIEFQFTLDPSSFSSGQLITRSLEIADPRMGGLARTWQQAPHFTDPTAQSADTLGRINNATTAANYDTRKLAFVDLTQPGPSSNHPSTGFLSVIPTGMQRGIAGSSPRFQPSGPSPILPDWLLLDLIAPNVTATNLGQMSYMNGTAGKVNVNAQIAPNGGRFALPARFVPLQALVQNMQSASTVIGATPPIAPSALVNAITQNTLAPVGGTNYGATSVYDYDGEICEIAGVSDVDANGNPAGTDWDKESIIRNLASSITTKSNVFSVWGVAQTVKKNPANNNPTRQGVFETRSNGATADDIVTGEKRFEAVIERYVWSGIDASPGNGHVSGSGGTYDKLSTGQTSPGYAPPYAGGSWELIDGPDTPTYPVSTNPDPWVVSAPNYVTSSLDLANNPVSPLMKYRVIFFKYLNE